MVKTAKYTENMCNADKTFIKSKILAKKLCKIT